MKMPRLSSEDRKIKRAKRKKKGKKKTQNRQRSSPSSSASPRLPSPTNLPHNYHYNDRNTNDSPNSTSTSGRGSSSKKKSSRESDCRKHFVCSSHLGRTHRRRSSADNVSEGCCTCSENAEEERTTVQAFPTVARVAAAAVHASVRQAAWPATCFAARATTATESEKGVGRIISPTAAAAARIALNSTENDESRQRIDSGHRRSGWDVKPTAEDQARETEELRKKRRRTRQRRNYLSDSSVEENIDAGPTARDEDVGQSLFSKKTRTSSRPELQDCVNTSSKDAKYTNRSISQSAAPAVGASVDYDYEVKTYEKAFGLAVGKYTFVGEEDFSSATPAPAAPSVAAASTSAAAAAAAMSVLNLPGLHAGNIRNNKVGDKVNSKTHPHLFWQCWSCNADNYKTRHQCYRCNKLYQK